MTIAYGCVLFMGLFPYVAAGIAKKGSRILTTVCRVSGLLIRRAFGLEPMLLKQICLSLFPYSLPLSSSPRSLMPHKIGSTYWR